MNKINKPILVTGSHRSGSTWAGKMIAKAKNVGYIHEPFNINSGLGIYGRKFQYWFTYICKENENEYYNDLKNILNFNFKKRNILKLNDPRKIYFIFLNYYNQYRNKLSRKKLRPLIKDPLALFSAEWLAKKFNMNILIMIRHPAAFVSSLKRLDWRFDFNNFAKQELLIQHKLFHHKDTILDYIENRRDIIHQGILLWNIIHEIILNYQKQHPEWIFVKHEDLSKNPIDGFEKIFYDLNLEFGDDIKKYIQSYSKSSNPSRAKSDKHNFKLDSKKNISSWKKRLSEKEIESIKKGTWKIAQNFYTEKDW